MKPLYILYKPRPLYPTPEVSIDGDIISSGAIGWVDKDNVNFVTRASFPRGSSLEQLEVGGVIVDVEFQSGGVRSLYDVYRVQ